MFECQKKGDFHGKLRKNFENFALCAENQQKFKENGVKIEIFGASRRHVCESENLVGGDPGAPGQTFSGGGFVLFSVSGGGSRVSPPTKGKPCQVGSIF